jgi:hypothetical protein
MADKIRSYYLKAGEMGGVKARARLSLLTSINSIEANDIPDSEENIMIFEKAMKHIMKEFNGDSSVTSVLRLKILKLLLMKETFNS